MSDWSVELTDGETSGTPVDPDVGEDDDENDDPVIPDPDPTPVPTPDLDDSAEPDTVVPTPTPTPTPNPDSGTTPAPDTDHTLGEKVEYNGATKFTLTAKDWTYTFTDLPATNSKGQEYVYFVVEDEIPGYDSTYVGELDGPNGTLTIQNRKYVYKDTYLDIEKKWLKADGTEDTAPTDKTIKFNLWRIQTEREVEDNYGSLPTVDITFTIQDKDGGTETKVTKTLIKGATYTWTPIITAADNPNAAPSSMKATYNGKTYTLSRVTSGGVVPVRYGMTFTAAKDGEIVFSTGAANLTNDTWKHTFTLTEDADAGVLPPVEDDEDSTGTGDSTGTDNTTEATAFSMRAVSRASEVVNTTGATLIDTYELSSSNSWQKRYTNLPTTGTDDYGNNYNYVYIVEEVEVPFGYEVSYGNNAGVIPTANGTTITISNKKIDQNPFALKVNKVWANIDGSTTAPSNAEITLELHQVATGSVGKPVDSTTIVGYENAVVTNPVTIKQDSNWTYTFEKLPSCSKDGTILYTYYVKESASKNVNGYTVSYSNSTDGKTFTALDAQTAADGVTITNTQKTTRVQVVKQWQDSDGINITPPAGDVKVTLTLQRYTYNTNGVAENVQDIATINLPDENGSWEWDKRDLPAVEPSSGKAYYYKLKTGTGSESVTGIPTGITFEQTTSSNGVTRGQLRMTNKVKTTSVEVNKKWFGAPFTTTTVNGKPVTTGTALNGNEAFLPDEIEIALLRGVQENGTVKTWSRYDYYTVTKADNWKLTINNLPAFTTDSTGTPVYYQYRVAETAVDGYTTSYENNNGTATATTPIVINNTMIPQTYKVTKVYEYGSLTTPPVTVKLYRSITQNGKTLSELVPDNNNAGAIDGVITLPQQVDVNGTTTQSWTYTWDALPTIGSITQGGVTVTGQYKYTVREVEPQGFIASYTYSDTEATITNTPTALKVTKEYRDLASGTATYIANKTIHYKVIWTKIDMSTGQPYEGENNAPNTGVAIWDSSKQTWELKSGASATEGLFTLTSGATGKWPVITHQELPVYASDSVQYRYSIVETDAKGNEVRATYDKSVVDITSQQTITITNTVTSIPVRKIWSNVYGTLPANLPDVKLTLMRKTSAFSDATVDPNFKQTITLTQSQYTTGATAWAYTFTNLETYGYLNGQEVQWHYYLVEENAPDGFQHIEKADINNIGITGQYGSSQVISITNALITYELPETGGAGTTPYTVGGLLLMLAATVLLYRELHRKKQWGEGRES